MLYATVMDAYASNVDFCTKYKQILINYPKSVYTRDVSMLKKRVCQDACVLGMCILGLGLGVGCVKCLSITY